jgi:hypothetical protein
MGAIGKRGMLVEVDSVRRFCFFQRLNNGRVAAMAKCAARSDWAAS